MAVQDVITLAVMLLLSIAVFLFGVSELVAKALAHSNITGLPSSRFSSRTMNARREGLNKILLPAVAALSASATVNIGSSLLLASWSRDRWVGLTSPAGWVWILVSFLVLSLGILWIISRPVLKPGDQIRSFEALLWELAHEDDQMEVKTIQSIITTIENINDRGRRLARSADNVFRIPISSLHDRPRNLVGPLSGRAYGRAANHEHVPTWGALVRYVSRVRPISAVIFVSCLMLLPSWAFVPYVALEGYPTLSQALIVFGAVALTLAGTIAKVFGYRLELMWMARFNAEERLFASQCHEILTERRLDVGARRRSASPDSTVLAIGRIRLVLRTEH